MEKFRQYGNRLARFTDSGLVRLILVMTLMLVARMTFAEDALSAAEPVIKDTYNKTIKTYLYVGEAIAAVVTLIFTRNIKTLGGVGAIAIFLNIVAKLAGI